VLDIHPTGALWGEGDTLAAADVSRLEIVVAEEHPLLVSGLRQARLKQERRPLRVRVSDLSWEQTAGALKLNFALRSGSYATAVVREVVSY